MDDVMVYGDDIVNELDNDVTSRKTRGWVARHVLRHYVQAFRVSNSIPSFQRYCQASLGIKGLRRLELTINWIFGYS
ncbi:hypothetical protein F383_37883 [Gossypium arboreum]|uniref:Uncharacterized protein n=1 Tax=Gossypium arboreum TaxID=29729 RepID=A0A0B0MCQ3_GOSAR|nr:hypothetical protein F383_37883 [Gossypium arboreum]